MKSKNAELETVQPIEGQATVVTARKKEKKAELETVPAVEQASVESAEKKKKKKVAKLDGALAAEPKSKKDKPKKGDKKVVDEKDLNAPKEDKLTKFLVSMNKSLRKSLKKDAAEVGVSMNEYIVVAVQEKLSR